MHLRIADLFAIGIPILLGLVLVSSEPGSGADLLLCAVFSMACRVWATHRKGVLPQLAGNFYITVPLWIVYTRLNPVIDLVSPVPYDRDLQAIDQALFGVQPSVWLEQFHTPWLTELLFWCYTGFFFWQVALGVLLFVKKKFKALDDYLLTVIAFYLCSHIMYVLVPAIGPRFDLAQSYSIPLEGLWLADSMREAFVGIPMLRDCYPSGHTGLTLLVLFHAVHKREHVFFAIMLPFALLLIFSTVYCRFHYVIDLMCAIPFTAGILLLQNSLKLALPEGLTVRLPESERAQPHVQEEG